MIGTTLSHFRITAKLGQGGMGEVYEAWDESLERSVALKILPPEVVRDPDRVRRFVQEAKSASALSHPHIVTIYEIGEARSVLEVSESPGPEPQDPGPALHFIAMERINGSTFKTKIHDEQASPKDLLRWLGQAAEGLAKAHSEGIVHRDLKPDNIMITSDGYAKVLDFGLAKLSEPLTEVGNTHVPTMAGDQTAEGAVMGTVGYMSPEQVQGKRVDYRTDIFSFGCLLYEAMTGQRPFEGETAVDTMHQILRAKPASVREVSPETPSAVRRVIRRCLAKDPERRYQSMKDLGLGLADLVDDWDELASRSDSVASTASGSLAAISAPPDRKRWLGMAAAVTIVALSVLAIVQFIQSSNPPPVAVDQPVASFSRITQQPGVEYEPNLSPDGRYVVYVSDAEGEDDIYLLRVGGRNPVNLTEGSGANNRAPAFSPDGELIAFFSDRDGGGIFVMGATGESVRRLTDFGFNPTWSPDGKKIAFATEGHSDPYGRTAKSELWVVELAGGEPVRISEGDAMQPTWSPDGRTIAFWGIREFDGGGAQREIGTIRADGGEPRWVVEDSAVDWSPVWSPGSESLYYISDRGGSANIWRIGLDPASGEATGQPRPLTAPSRLVSRIAISGDGKQMVFTDENVSSNVARVELETASGAGLPVAVTRGSSEFVQAQASPDGEWVAFRSTGSQEDLYVVRADGSDLLQLTDDSAKDRRPSWSPVGEQILFYSDRSGRYEFWVMNRDGSGLEQVTDGEGDSFFYPKWSPDGEKISATTSNSSAIWDLSLTKPARDYELLPPIDEDGRYLFDPEWSPDGTRLAGVVLRANQAPSGNEGVAIYSLDSGEYEIIYEPEEGLAVLGAYWRSDGLGMFLELRRSDDSHVLATLDLEKGGLEELWTAPEGAVGLAPSSDGKTVYFIQGVEETDLWLATFQ
ncbi:MAG: protein kinase [Thermoanaerobaculia bacterium]